MALVRLGGKAPQDLNRICIDCTPVGKPFMHYRAYIIEKDRLLPWIEDLQEEYTVVGPIHEGGVPAEFLRNRWASVLLQGVDGWLNKGEGISLPFQAP